MIERRLRDCGVYRLHGWYVAEDDDAIELRSWTGRRLRMKAEGFGGARLLGALREIAKGVSADAPEKELSEVAGLEERFAARLLQALQRAGALQHVSGARAMITDDLYDRQVRFLDMYGDGRTEFNERLQQSKVVVVGLGAFGSWLVTHLHRMGVRRIVGFDHDTVERSNLSRQILYEQRDVGLLKAQACQQNLARLDSRVEVRCLAKKIERIDDLAPHLDDASLVFNGFAYNLCDSTGEAIARACIAASVPSLAFGQVVGPLHVPQETACYCCALADASTGPRLRGIGQLLAPVNPCLAPRQAILCAVVAWEAVRFLSGIDIARSINAVISIDIQDYSNHQLWPIGRTDSCQLCGTFAA